MTDDEKFMRKALDEARIAFDRDEVPIGAVIVSHGRVIARAHNMTEALTDVTAHAEMQAITSATSFLGGKHLTYCSLCLVMQPSLLFAGAIGWAQIPRVVYGAPDDKRGYHTYTASPFHKKTTVTAGVLEAECAALMTEFFKNKR